MNVDSGEGFTAPWLALPSRALARAQGIGSGSGRWRRGERAAPAARGCPTRTPDLPGDRRRRRRPLQVARQTRPAGARRPWTWGHGAKEVGVFNDLLRSGPCSGIGRRRAAGPPSTIDGQESPVSVAGGDGHAASKGAMEKRARAGRSETAVELSHSLVHCPRKHRRRGQQVASGRPMRRPHRGNPPSHKPYPLADVRQHGGLSCPPTATPLGLCIGHRPHERVWGRCPLHERVGMDAPHVGQRA